MLLMLYSFSGCFLEEDLVNKDTGNIEKDQDRDGFSVDDGDCDDLVPTTNPQATDIVDDGIDQNCDGIDGTDQDRDGYASELSGGNDCDDNDPTLHQNDIDEDGFST